MNIAGTEWIIIILLALVLLFGTKKLPQVSRSVGKAVGEFEKAREMFRKEMEEASQEARGTNIVPRITRPVSSERQKLETLADSLGIDDHEGLTDEELRSLISKRLAR
ncbi:MAG TPA: twin-arginine translocase TatA/TatE family subunit [Nitrososphaera sp.]|nr:twin-arginine translocase TatA/TatE family subunit [Nitrososphaera sp.]